MLKAYEVMLLCGGGFSAILVGVLLSLWKSRVAGVRHWLIGNAIIVATAPVFYLAWTVQPFLVTEVANTMYGVATVLFVVGYRKHFNKSPLWLPLLVALVVQFAALSWYHYVDDLVHVRVLIATAFHAICGAVMVWTLWRVRMPEIYRYPLTMARAVAVLQVFYLLSRILAQVPYFTGGNLSLEMFLNGSNIILLSLGLLLWPSLTLAGASLVTAKILSNAHQEAKTDFLTNCWTRRALVEFAERELQRSERTDRPLALLVLDIDDFKQINDTFGHPAGDSVLAELALQLEQSMRSIDYVCRMGGEEFAVLMPDTSYSKALEVAERIRTTLAKPRPATIHFTVSIGVATHVRGAGWLELYEKADRALVEAKRRGKNRVVGDGSEQVRTMSENGQAIIPGESRRVDA